MDDATMADVMTPAEAAACARAAGDPPFLLVAQDRARPVRRRDAPPKAWRDHPGDLQAGFVGDARPGECYPFQAVVWNPGPHPLRIVRVAAAVDGMRARCLNTDARPADDPFPADGIALAPGAVRALWVLAEVPGDASGERRGRVEVTCRDSDRGREHRRAVAVTLRVSGAPLPRGGTDDAHRLSRLRWLLPTDLGEGNTPTRGYAPVRRSGRTLTLAAVRLTLGDDGLPAGIDGLLDGGNVARADRPTPLLAAPARWVARTDSGPVALRPRGLRFERATPAAVRWSAVSEGGGITLTVDGHLAFDGRLVLKATVAADRTLRVRDLAWEAPLVAATARWAMGLGVRGGRRPDTHDFVWDTSRHQDRIWMGGVNVGAQWQFVGANYRRPLVNIYYGLHPLALPDSWGNGGRGGIGWRTERGVTTLRAFTGERTLTPEAPLSLEIRANLTPSRPLDTDRHWNLRISHGDPESMRRDARADGATVVNIHQGNELNPFINYPFHPEAIGELSAYVRAIHAQGLKAKVYYTTRELTKELPEFWALTHLDGAVIQPGPGPATRTLLHPNGPHPWLAENVRSDFIPAWANGLPGRFAGREDISVLTRPDGPWNAFYLNGLAYLLRVADIDGLYIDDTALDRETLQRARRMIETAKGDASIDLHSWNPYDDLDFRYTSAGLYLDLLPYVDRIWFGEGANYGQDPDAWLVQYAGIPYGLTGEMLEGGGNPWRGMVYGMTCRLYGGSDPRPLWRFFAQVGMTGTTLRGWWDPACPVSAGRDDLRASAFVKPGQAVVAVASWANGPVSARLALDPKRLGFVPRTLEAREIAGFQKAAVFAPGEAIPVAPGKGWLLIARP